MFGYLDILIICHPSPVGINFDLHRLAFLENEKTNLSLVLASSNVKTNVAEGQNLRSVN